MSADDLYRGFLIMLLRKSYWYTAQLAFVFMLFFMVNPRFLSPLVFVGVGTIFFLYLATHFYWSSARAIRTNTAYRHEMEFVIDQTGLSISGPTFSSHNDWCNYQAVIEDSKIFLFCPSNSQMVVLPKRCFANDSQIETLRQLLRANYRGKLSLKH